MKSLETVTKWALSNDFIKDDSEANRVLISVISKGVSILDRDKQFSSVTPIDKHILTNEISVLKLALLNLPSAPSSAPSSMPNNKSKRITTAPIKLFQKLPATRNYLTPGFLNSQVSKDYVLGVPTFAILSAEIQVKTASEQSLGLICNNLANFPSIVSSVNVTRISSLWDEIKENAQFQKINGIFSKESDINSEESFGTALRYFSFDNRIIFGITERPFCKEKQMAPKIAITIRDGSGKYTWFAKCKYEDKINNIGMSAAELVLLKTEKIDKVLSGNLDSDTAEIPNEAEELYHNLSSPKLDYFCPSINEHVKPIFNAESTQIRSNDRRLFRWKIDRKESRRANVS